MTPAQAINGKQFKESIIVRATFVILVLAFLLGFPRTLRGEYLHISMERFPCLGPCPYYKMDIYGSGLVTYRGDLRVREKGFRIGFISQSKIQELIVAINSSQYFLLENRYNLNITDNPGTMIFIHYKDSSKEISHYPDGRAPYRDVAPPALGKLEGSIEDIVRGWIGE